MVERPVPAPVTRLFSCGLRKHAGKPAVTGILPLALAVALLAGGLPGSAAIAADTGQIAQEKQKLQLLRERINNLKGELESVRGQHDAQQTALEQTDKAIGRITAELRRLDGQEATAREELTRLEDERDAVRSRLGRMRAALARELQTAYRNGRQERIKLLLNQDDPALVGRMLTYQGYFTRARGTAHG